MSTIPEQLLKSIPRFHGIPILEDHEVHLWLVSYRALCPRSTDMAEILSGVETKRSEAYRFPKDRQKYILRHGVLRMLMALYLSARPEDIRFGVGEHGKPHVEGVGRKHSIEFNLSHSGDMLLFGFALGRHIGVDIEFEKQMEDMEAIVKNNFSHNEKVEFDTLPTGRRLEAFYRGWTQKEAFVKALWDGLYRGLDQFDVSMAPGAPGALKRTAWDGAEAARWTLETMRTISGYSVSAAVEGAGLRFMHRELHSGIWR